MSDTSKLTTFLDIQQIQEGMSPHPWFDRAIQQFDALIMPAIEDRDILTPAGGETAGQMWLIDGTGTGAWVNKNNMLAIYYPTFDADPPENVDQRDPWMFTAVYNGMRLWVKDENIFITRNAGSWFAGSVITNPIDLPTLITAVNDTLTALRGHGFLDV